MKVVHLNWQTRFTVEKAVVLSSSTDTTSDGSIVELNLSIPVERCKVQRELEG